MPGIPREVAEHALDIRAGSRPVKQCMCRFDEEKRRAIDEEVQKLLAAGFIKEVSHPEWLANPVLVKKKNGKWRMCVDYIGLNKACPKDHFPLPHIDQIVNSTLKALVWFWLIDETVSANLVYQDDHEIGSTTPNDEAMTKIMTLLMIECLNLEKKKEKNKRLKIKV